MLPYFTEHFGNAASRNHAFGWEAEEAVEAARKQIAALIGANRKRSSSPAAPPSRTTWRSRASPRCTAEKGNHIITAATEHKAVLDTCKRLEKQGCR
jgi:cysteine desulfurase